MQRFYIIADDLTGANDAGVQLSKIGIASTVFLDFTGSSLPTTKNVAIIDTNSRAISESAAYDTVHKASSVFYQQGYDHVYKKMDSTLRGNVAAELAAVVDVHQPEVVVVAPAFPKMNRKTVNGYQYVNGEQVSDTEFGRDPKTPVKDSFIPNLFKKYVDDPICVITSTLISQSKESLKTFILENTNQGRTWFICDAMTDKDLKTIAEVFAAVNKKTVWAGSAGLIEYLPNALRLEKTKQFGQQNMQVIKTLIVSASLSEVTKQQLADVQTMSDSYFVEMNPVELIRKTYSLQDIVDDIMKHAGKKHFIVFVDSSTDNRNATKLLETELSLSNTEIGEAISRELGRIAEAIVQACPEITGLVLTGGDTAKAVCNQLKMNQMELDTEIEPGLPIGKLSGSTGTRTFWTVTKAGGFGNEHSLSNALKYMTRKVN